MMFDFSHKKKMQVYDNLRSVMQICIDRIVNLNKDGKGKQDAEALRDDFAYAFHCMDLCCEYRWIPVTERLPEDGQEVLIMTKKTKAVRLAKYLEEYSYFDIVGGTNAGGIQAKNVSLWMTMPEPPEEG